jgi:nicotinamide-nucleotide amidase
VSGSSKLDLASPLREHRVRAGIVVTGTEVLAGIIRDDNGPWLSERLRERGVQLVAVHVVGDRPDDLLAGLELFRDLDLVITSGGLGPTADDLTAEVVSGFAGVPMDLDDALEERIWSRIKALSSRWRDVTDEALRAGNRKQAMVPRGATVLEPVGTAPGLVVRVAGGPVVLVLPGPPGELQPMWEEAVRLEPIRSVLDRAGTFERRIMRVTGVPEAQLAEVLRELQLPSSLEITTCLRRGELEISTVFEPPASADYDSLEAELLERFGARIFSRDGSTIDDMVGRLLLGPPVRTVAVAESCTGGLMAARLTDRPGSSAYVLGGVTAYSNEAKVAFADVPPELIERHGAVSPEVGRALAAGAVARFGASFGIGITGIAGPDGGTEEKPVGTVCVCVAGGDGSPLIERAVRLPGDRGAVRDRTTTLAMHLLRRAIVA